MEATIERYDTVVIGAGQAGLAAGYHLQQAGRKFVIVDAGERVGDVWRKRYDSLRLFTPGFLSGLPGWSFPGGAWHFPTKDEVADYFEGYVQRFALPVRTGTRVTRLSMRGDRFLLETTAGLIEADDVVVATGMFARPRIPDFALDVDARIVQLHAAEYRNPGTLRPGGVLVVGAGNSGAEIALEVARTHHTLLSGRYRRMKIGPSRSPILAFVMWQFLYHLATIKTPIGRRLRARMGRHPAMPVERVSLQMLTAAGVERVARVTGVRGGRPALDDGAAVDVANIIWCTGYRSDLDWIDLPIFDEDGQPRQVRGVADVPGLYFVGRWFQYGFASALIAGVGRDAEYVVRRIASRAKAHGREGTAPRTVHA